MALSLKVQDVALESTATAILKQLQLLNENFALLEEAPTSGMFNPPANLVKSVPVEVMMSVLELEVGQTATGVLTFDETTPPADGAVASDSPAVTISLAADLVTWTAVGVSATGMTPANCTYTGTSVAPDVGAAVVPPMVVTVIPVPTAEHGDFNPATATITGP